MQQSDDEWCLRAAGDDVELNDAAADALELEPGTVDRQDLAGAGPPMETGVVPEVLGAWLLHLLDPGDSVTLQRATTAKGSQVEALVSDSTVRARLSQAPSPFRTLRHGLNNQLNNIQINAELVRLLASRGSDAKLQAAIERVLAECRNVNEFLAEQLKPDLLGSDDWFACDEALPALLGPPTSSSDTGIRIAAATNLPAGVLTGVAGLVRVLQQTLDTPASYSLTGLHGDDQAELVIEAIAGQPLDSFLRSQWEDRDRNPHSLANLSRQATAFRGVANGDRLSLSIHAPPLAATF